MASMILATIMMIVNYNTSSHIAQNTQKLYKELIPASEYSTNNKFLFNQMIENMALAVTSSELDILEQSNKQAEQIRANFKTIEQTLPTLQNTKKASMAFEQYYTLAMKASASMISNNAQLMAQMANSNDLFDKLNGVKSAFDDLDSEIKTSIKTNFSNIEFTTEIIISNEFYTIVTAYCVLFFLTYVIYKNINRRFKVLIHDIVNLSKSSLESRRRFDKVSNDELGLLTKSLNQILDTYENDVNQLTEEKMTFYDLSHKDKLTGLYNRHYLDSVFVEYEHKLPQGFVYGVIILDVDHFKKVNDTYGHQVGDDVLKFVAYTLDHNVRKSDVIGRWGGEEFMCIITTNDPKLLFDIAEGLRKVLEKSVIEVVGHITASFGAAMSTSGANFVEVIENADKALYDAKKEGRNRVKLFS